MMFQAEPDFGESMTGSQLQDLVMALQQEVIRLNGRELYMCQDDLIWHRDGDRMFPLADDGSHIDPDALHNRGSIEVQRMRNARRFPTLKQLQDTQKTPLKRVTELDVVRRHARLLEARIVELESQVPGA
jgi:hypothetical protein